MTNADSAAPLNFVFQALADPTRRLLLERLTLGPASVSELARPFAMSLPAIVQHLQLLEGSGLVRTEKVGRVRTCHIQTAPLRNAERWIGERRTTWERRFDRLGEILASEPDSSSSAAAAESESAAESAADFGSAADSASGSVADSGSEADSGYAAESESASPQE